jgi:hydroxymethylpyrimidine pyrophosphatase-like HAD family hydrolase
VRCLYVDLDGTLLGPGGALFRGGDGAFDLLGARALEACSRAGAEVVVMTGRRRADALEAARLLGQTSCIFEAGAGYAIDGEEHWLTQPYLPGERTIHDQIADTGAPALLLERYAGSLEPHEPWAAGRDVSHLLRGLVDVAEAEAMLEAEGHADLRLVENGVTRHRSAALDGLPVLRIYHLVPRGVSKATAVAAHARARGYAREDCVAVGDSREDLATARSVGAFWLVANAVDADPGIRSALADHQNARTCEAGHGAGVYEAVVSTLATRGG